MKILDLEAIMIDKNYKYCGNIEGFYKFVGNQNEGLKVYISNIFENVFVIITDYENTYEYNSSKDIYINNLELSYCYRGRLEWEFEENKFSYLVNRSFMMDTLPLTVKKFDIPTGSFGCISYYTDVRNMSNNLKENFKSYGVDIEECYKKVYGSEPYILRNNEYINNVFKNIGFGNIFNINLHKIKYLEILNYVSSLKLDFDNKFSYYKRSQIDKVKEVKEFLINNLNYKYSIEYLSSKFSIPKTTLKELFKNIYGMPINTYLIDYKMDKAEDLLNCTNLSITEIATSLGYLNASKFSERFKKSKGITPTEYKNIRR